MLGDGVEEAVLVAEQPIDGGGLVPAAAATARVETASRPPSASRRAAARTIRVLTAAVAPSSGAGLGAVEEAMVPMVSGPW
nr:hypothetical protein GCM10025730_17210 [Promicromonospora thailandica]